MSTGLCTHSLTIGLFTRWNLHKITFVVSGVESIVVTAQDREGINNVVKPQQASDLTSTDPRVEASYVGQVRVLGLASGSMAGHVAASFPSVNEDREYAPGLHEGEVQSRYNIEDYANVEGEDSDTGTESGDDGGSGAGAGFRGRGSSGKYGAGSRRRGSGHRTGVELQHFDLTLDSSHRHVVGGNARLVPGMQKDGSLLAKNIIITFRLKPGFDFIVVKAIRIVASINDL